MSWTVLPITTSDVRTLLDINGTSNQFQDSVIGSNIRVAASYLERATGRQFEAQTATTKKFTTENKAFMAIPDLRTATSVTLQTAPLVEDESFWLIPDAQQSGVFTGIQFRAFGRGDNASYLSNPEWFDRNLDRLWTRGYTTLPNDLIIVGEWGHDPLPHEFLQAVKFLAAFYTRRPASLLADTQVTPEGTELRYSQFPVEVRSFIAEWVAGPQLVSIG